MLENLVNNIFAKSSYLKSLSKDEWEQHRFETKEKWESAQEHMKKLELAEAGRPRNFWGK